MKIEEVKYSLGKPVRLKMPRHYIDSEYLLTGCILRKSAEDGFYYQAELADKAGGSLVIAPLNDISRKEEQT